MEKHSLGRIRPYSAQLVELTRIMDAVLIVLSLWLLARMMGYPWVDELPMLGWFASLVFIMVASANDLYRSWRSESLIVEVSRIAAYWAVSAVGTVFAAYLLIPESNVSRALAATWFFAAPSAVVVSRVVIRLALRLSRVRGHNYRNTAIIGSTDIAIRIAKSIQDAPWMGLKFVGFYDDRKLAEERVATTDASEILGTTDDLIQAARGGNIDRVYITLPMRAELRIKDVIDQLSELPVTVLYVPDFFLFTMLHAQWEQLGATHVVNVVTTPFLGVSGLIKRLEDIVLASVILVLIAIPLAAIALAIRSTSPGPVIFRQRRYGLNGKEFEIWKFRTMTVIEDGAEFVQARPYDVRVTRLGAMLRRTSLDELPQFINVLRGDMSIVGPRPHPVALDEQHRRLIPSYYFRHKIRPGITGLAQINGLRGPTDTLDKMRRRIEHDIQYIDQWSLMLDLRIIWLTVVRGFVDENAL